MPTITESRELPRGCGHRKGGGIYLVADGMGRPCGRLPVEMATCPACGQGVKPARGWTWIEPGKLFAGHPCKDAACPADCPLSEPAGMGRAGLLWIGGQFYRSPEDFSAEAARLGVSRRISQVPKDFEVGRTWVFVGHREAIRKPCPDCAAEAGDHFNLTAPGEIEECVTCDGRGSLFTPAVFHAFQPTRIEYVLKGDETEEELERLEKRGLSLVRVTRLDEDGELIEPKPSYTDPPPGLAPDGRIDGL